MLDILEILFGWLINLSSPHHIFNISGNEARIDNPYSILLKVLILSIFLIPLHLLPIYWFGKTILWWLKNLTNSIE